jgi:hypothetical protein
MAVEAWLRSYPVDNWTIPIARRGLKIVLSHNLRSRGCRGNDGLLDMEKLTLFRNYADLPRAEVPSRRLAASARNIPVAQKSTSCSKEHCERTSNWSLSRR